AGLAQGIQHLLAGGDVGVEVRGEAVCWRVGSVAVIVVVGSLFQRLFASKKIVLYSSVFAERRAEKRGGSVKAIAYTLCSAQVAELVDAHGSGPCAARCGGSSPLLGTTSLDREVQFSTMSSGIKKRNPRRRSVLRVFCLGRLRCSGIPQVRYPQGHHITPVCRFRDRRTDSASR